jgi:spore maturation protein CgeB
MRIVVFGLAVSSAWGNGHATLWRGLLRALAERGCHVTFFEHDVPYYADNRDLWSLPGGELVLYPDWPEALPPAQRSLQEADAAIVTSFCPHGIEAFRLIAEAGRPLSVFYDLDTPVTLDLLATGAGSTAIGPEGLAGYDLVLSYTGGAALQALRDRLGALRVAPLYGHVDPGRYKPGERQSEFSADLSYIGTYAEDRQAALERLLVEPARRRADLRFLIAGAQYPHDFPWASNIWYVRHIAPAAHPAFYASSRLTLNVTRRAMAAMGWCPSGRLFEAAACEGVLVSDAWEGLDAFFEPGREILVAETTEDVLAALARSPEDLAAIGRRARERVLAEHTSDRRAATMLDAIESAASDRASRPATAQHGPVLTADI